LRQKEFWQCFYRQTCITKSYANSPILTLLTGHIQTLKMRD